jgi:hypothetical protein
MKPMLPPIRCAHQLRLSPAAAIGSPPWMQSERLSSRPSLTAAASRRRPAPAGRLDLALRERAWRRAPAGPRHPGAGDRSVNRLAAPAPRRPDRTHSNRHVRARKCMVLNLSIGTI